ncbi:Gfo/Idh/MocA family protein [Amycolatopsis magusensis]|uniref:Gfo/Idh/MocA family protein n=1 Tax=Amycolatopsis magusensis TaxID=882444 RepID=UPI0037B92EBA
MYRSIFPHNPGTDLDPQAAPPRSDAVPDAGPVRVGVIGLRHGARHVRGFEQATHSTVTAVCDLDPRRARETAAQAAPGCLTTSRIDEVLASSAVDAVVVSVPNHDHATVAEQALRAGKHVVVEKPMATTGRDAAALVALADARGLTLAAFHDFRADPAHWAAHELVRSGALGEVYFARTTWTRRDNAPGALHSGSWYLDRSRAGGGVLLDLGTHRIDQVLWMLGFPEVVAVTGAVSRQLLSQRADGGGDVEDTACGTLQLAGGAVVQVETSFLGHVPRAEDVLLELRGSRGGLRVSNVGDSYRAYQLTMFGGRGGIHEQTTFPVLTGAPSLYEDFAAAVRTDSAPLCPGWHAAAVAGVIDRMYAAARAVPAGRP